VICIIAGRQYIELDKMLIFNTFIECCQYPCLNLQDVQEDVQEMDVDPPLTDEEDETGWGPVWGPHFLRRMDVLEEYIMAMPIGCYLTPDQREQLLQQEGALMHSLHLLDAL
jgi:hypothetical protein